MPASSTAYRAPFWLPGGNLQTLYPAMLAPRPRIHWRRVRWDTPDGDFIDLDWTEPRDCGMRIEDGGRPLLVLFHGLEGSSNSHYARALMDNAVRRGWRGVVAHFRGCSGEINRLPRAYHSGDSTEIDWILRRLRAQCAGDALFAAGVSLGGNALLKWLGEQGDAARAVVDRAAAISAPVDLMAAGYALERGFNMLYTRNFLATMKRKSLAKLARHPGLFDPARLGATRTLREFDDLITSRLHGFNGVDDYYTRASSKPHLARITVPALLLNARNDPFLPDAALPAPHELSSAITPAFPDEGGHVGFPDARGSFTWMPRTVLEFLAAG
ncbi:MAG: hydrolase [Burkholderiales bacterium]